MQSRPFLARASLVLTMFLAACGGAEAPQSVATGRAALTGGEISLFGNAPGPSTPDPDAVPVELGVKFRSEVGGTVHGIRFHKLAGNGGTHTGTLWSEGGVKLAEATFTNETATGWQEVRFAQGVQVDANTIYVASYHAPLGHYSATNGGFSTAVDAAPLQAPGSDEVGGNGVYVYGASAFPTETYQASNYWVDVIFAPDATSTLSVPSQLKVQPVDADSVQLTWVRSVQRNGEVQPTPAAHHLVYRDGTLVATIPGTQGSFRDSGLDPTSTYSYTVRGQDDAGRITAPSNTATATTPTDAPCYPCSLWNSVTGKPQSQTGNGTPVELGLKFRADVAGEVTAIRFYQVSLDTGEHVGHLWSEDGQLLATTEVRPADTGFGWRELTFASPVTLSPGALYVVSYYSPAGYHALSTDYFAFAGVDVGPLHAPSALEVGGNGVRNLGGSAFPTEAWYNANLGVDVVFTPADTSTLSKPSQLEALAVDAHSVDLTWVRSVQRNGELPSTPAAHHLVFRDGVLVATLPGTQATFRDSGLDPTTTYSYTVRGQDELGLVTLPSNADAATTTSDAPCNPCSLWDDVTGNPQYENADTTPVELGLKFRANVAGAVTGIRFYKGSTDTADHVGHLWTEGGQLLATTQVRPAESGFGWRELTFATPITLLPDTVYVVSYFAPVGRHAFSQYYFESAGVEVGPLHAPQAGEVGGNGVRNYGASAFPTEDWRHANYWVDVIFAPAQ